MGKEEDLLGIFTTDRDLVIRSWGEGLAAATGIDGDAARGRGLLDLFPDIAARGLTERFRRVLDEGVVETLAPAFHHYLLACPPRKPSAFFEYMQQRVTIAPLRSDEGILGTLVTVEDVTARREREKALVADLSVPEEERRLRASSILAEGEQASELVAVLGDPSWRVRRKAVEGLARRTSADTVRDLLHALRKEHDNLSVLNSALQVLALSDMDTLTPLVAFLKDRDVELRTYAALLLGEKHDQRTVPALIEALDDPDANVRYHCIEALGKLRDPAATEALLSVLDTRDFFLAFPALDALARIGSPGVAERVVPLLEDPLLCGPAAEALGQMGEDDIVAPLAGLLNKADAPVSVVAAALTAIRDRYEQRFREGAYIEDLVRRAISPSGAQQLIDAAGETEGDELLPVARVLGWLEGTAVERAMTRFLGNPSLRREVIEALVRYEPRVVSLVVEQLKVEGLETRKAAAIALGRIGDPVATEPLATLLADDDELAVVAAGALAKIGDRGAFESLLAFLGHPQASVRQAVVGALNSLGHPDMGHRMRTFLEDPNPRVRESAIRIAGYFGYEGCRPILLQRTGDSDENVRRTAVEHLPYLDEEAALPMLCRIVREETPRVRAAAAAALVYFEGNEALAALTEALQDTDPWVRYFAARSLGQQGQREAVEPLIRMAYEDPAGQARIAAVKALGDIALPEVVPVLAALADGSDSDLAAGALAALGRIDHPEARSNLLRFLHSPDPQRRLGAIKGLGRRCDGTVAGILQWIAAADTEEEVGQAALEALAAAATPEAVSVLVGLTLEPSRRAAVIEALSGMGDEALAWIDARFDQPQTKARLALIEVLVRMKRPESTAILIRALEDPEAGVRIAAVQGLARLGSRRAERRLFLMATSDPSPEVRQAIRKALEGER